MRFSTLRRGWAAVATTALMLAVSVPASASMAAQGRQDRRDGAPYERSYGRARFDDHDRQTVHEWYRRHRNAPPPGLRDRDRLPANMSGRIVVGSYLDRDLRARAHAVPADLMHRLPPPPRGDRYLLVDGQLCAVDHSYRVEDSIRISAWWGE